MRKGNRRWLVGAAVVATALGEMPVLLELDGAEAPFDPCSNRVLRVVRSPDGKRKAVIFERDCGATTDFSTQVSILPRQARLRNVGGNTFIADRDHGAAPEGPGGGPEVKVIWENRTRLLIKHHPKARVFKSQSKVAGVTIRYAPLGPTPASPRRAPAGRSFRATTGLTRL